MSVERTLTNDADYLLCVLYDAYKQRRKNGVPQDEARQFGDPEKIQSDYIPQWSTEELCAVARELSRHGLAACAFGDDCFIFLALSTDGIAFMEQRFSRKLDELTSRIVTLCQLLGFSK